MRARTLALTGIVASWMILLGVPAWAAAEQCGGADMLNEFATRNPAAFEKVRAEAKALANTQGKRKLSNGWPSTMS